MTNNQNLTHKISDNLEQNSGELSKQMVHHIATLSRLALTDEEVPLYQKDLGQILQSFENLKTLSRSPLDDSLLTNLRHTQTPGIKVTADIVDNSLSTEDFIAQAPDREGVFIRVPAVLDRIT